ncbi:MAG: EAL domain-containing protein [Ilumatobacteraceae bacterium]|nr:EAL domain-containing protein [Ilumatobacteraceae bacterium]
MLQLRRSRARLVVASVSALFLVVYFALDGLAAEVVWDIAVFTQLVVAFGVISGFRRQRRAWLAILGAQCCFLAGDVGFALLEYVVRSDAYPSVADALYLAGYPLLAAGLIPIARTRRGRRDVGGLIDASIVTIASAAVLWVFIMDPTVGDSSTSVIARVVAVAYTAGDVLALGVLALMLTRRTGNERPFWYITAGVAAMFVGDVAFSFMALQDSYQLGGPIDALWYLNYTCFVLAVMHPGCEHLGDGATGGHTRLTPSRLASLAVAALAAPTVLIIRIESASTSQASVLLAGTLVMFVLVIVRLQLIAHDLDDSRRQLSYDASHDALTGLANRTLLADRAGELLARPGTTGTTAVLCLDLDDFKPVNDLLGHSTGDELLRVIARRLTDLAGERDVVARLGGDEFAILLADTDTDGAVAVAQAAIEAVRHSADIGGPVEVYPNVSIGITIGRTGDPVEDLLRDADIAMYSAKRRGKGQWALFEPNIAQHAMDWLELRADLTEALADGQLFVEFQPVVRLDDRRVVGAEALVRWQHPTLGLVRPDRFIPVAEDSGLIVPIGAWVLEQACRAAQSWSTDASGLDISVNVSPNQFLDSSFVDTVRSTLDATGLAPGRLVLEITETTQLADEAAAIGMLRALRSLGVRIALDDMGAGFASLRYLRSLPIDIVKLDRSFMTNLDDDSGLLSGLIGLLRSLDLSVIVEGVELEIHERTARELGALYAQGFRYSTSIDSEAFRRFIDAPARSAS